ncbi:MAG: division/cell wall cluster transcriptional repressor MraZ [Clostridia bacterium]|nr:division/cell wall cluster transcriptional repressor MraZ [Clostridia bacterium]
MDCLKICEKEEETVLGGTYTHSVDDKGRVIIPVKFKKELGLEFVITAGFDETLMIMSYQEWEKFLDRVFSNAPISQTRRLKRFFHGNMHEVSTDKQGRMQIPQQLREKIGVESEVVLVGNGEMVEIWTPERWEIEQGNLDSESIASSMDELMI